MSPQTDQFYDVLLVIEPNQQEIALEVTFRTAFVVTMKYCEVEN